jgi:hypothetical protein
MEWRDLKGPDLEKKITGSMLVFCLKKVKIGKNILIALNVPTGR